MALDRRVRFVGRVLDRTVRPIAELDAAQRRRLRREPPRQLRSVLVGPLIRGVRTRDLRLPGPAGPMPARAYRPPEWLPQGDLPVVVHFHGGGWTLGGLAGSDWLCSLVAARLRAVVLSVAYRLAPESPAPAAHDDACAATAWASVHARELGASPDTLVVMGDSAGGNLAATVALAARERGPRIAAQALLYPATDLTLSAPSLTTNAAGALLTTEDVQAYAGNYLGGSGVEPTDPRVSPLWAPDLSGLPPAVVVTAADDPIRDDGRRYAQRLREAGVPVRELEYDDLPHGFFSLPLVCRGAGRAADDLVAALRELLPERRPRA